MKNCSMCKENKTQESFNKSKSGKLGLHSQCRECQKIVRKEYYKKNVKVEKQKYKDYYQSEEGQIKIKEYKTKYYAEHKDRILRENRENRSTDHARNLANINRKKRLDNEPEFRLIVNMRKRVYKAMLGINKSESTEKLLGCTPSELRDYLESKFTGGMSWDNYGYYGWHVDHIIPCVQFDLTDPDAQKICFHYTNLQPLWGKENISKSGNIL